MIAYGLTSPLPNGNHILMFCTNSICALTGDKLGAWCPADNDTEPFYQVNFPKPVPIGTIGIQLPARESLNQPQTTYMKSYWLAYHKPGPGGDLTMLPEASVDDRNEHIIITQ